MGRTKGSKNKVKAVVEEKAIPLDPKDIKRQIRMLRKIKKDTHKGSEDRHDLCRKIRDLRKQLLPIIQEANNPEKNLLIEQIVKIRPEYKVLDMNLNKYTTEQLTKHLEYIKGRARLF